MTRARTTFRGARTLFRAARRRPVTLARRRARARGAAAARRLDLQLRTHARRDLAALEVRHPHDPLRRRRESLLLLADYAAEHARIRAAGAPGPVGDPDPVSG